MASELSAGSDGSARTAFRARMEDQCRRIERYRLQVLRRERRRLTIEEAAGEWIERHAAAYAASHPG